MKKNIHDFKSVQGKADEMSEFAQAAVAIAKECKHMIAFQKERAKIKKSYYDDLVSNGFTPDQALHIVSTDTYI